ncbi:hypothetical protein FSY45_24240 [Comamonas sp. Z1]|uniref:hypothetical protein n=1 Tax=Comamonas TaxID=283 RepID=UPI0009BD16AC|nr:MULTISPECIES: hypothetical protein [Comamonas]TYK71036.1 hypothetical protein FSY45_24240 [Comamonas sp. Z1]TYK73365.1 hypothetical protein FSY59_01665 [Comamonas sp. Z3]
MRKITNKGIAQIAVSAIMAAVLAACGGGGGGNSSNAGNSGSGGNTETPAPSTTTTSGVAAIGAPIVGGTVSLKCASGATATATTGADGTWKVSLKSSDYPCAIRVDGGQANGQALPTALHSVVAGAGIANITPLTDLIVGILSNSKPNAWFDTVTNGDLSGKISATALDNAQDKLKGTLASLPGKPALPSNFNPLTSAFNAQKGDAGDDLLESYGSALTSAGLTQTQAADNASNGKPLTEEAFAGTAFTFPNMTAFRAGAAKLLGGDYVLSIPDPVRELLTVKASIDSSGNVAQVGLPLVKVASLMGNRIAQYCKGEAGAMGAQQRGFYAYISEDWTPVTDTKELHGKIFNDYEDCINTGTVEFRPDDSVIFTQTGQAPDSPDFGFSKALTTAGMEDTGENALVHAKAYKITLNGKTTYAYISVATSKSSDKESRWGNYLTMGLSQ